MGDASAPQQPRTMERGKVRLETLRIDNMNCSERYTRGRLTLSSFTEAYEYKG